MATITGSVACSADESSVSASGSHGIPGAVAAASGNAESASAGSHGIPGAVAAVSGAATSDAAGRVTPIRGTVDAISAAAESASAGSHGIPGTVDAVSGPAEVGSVGEIWHIGTLEAISGEATVAAVGDIAHVGSAAANSSAARCISFGNTLHLWTPDTAANLAAETAADAYIWAPSTAANLGTGTLYAYTWLADTAADLAAEAVIKSDWESEQETSMPTGDPTPRPFMPITVYFMTARKHVDVATVPANRWFLCAPILGAGDDFADDGALPNWVGQRAVDEDGNVTYELRPPIEGEVIWFVPENKLYRYEKNDNGVWFWNKYASMPERSLEGQYFAEIYDPDRILAYWARILGAIQWRLSEDNRDLLEQGDPDLCEVRTIDALASNVGIVFAFEDTIPQRRARLRSAVSVYRRLGAPAAISATLRLSGYLGYAEEIWCSPTDPTNVQGPNNVYGYPSSSPSGALLNATKFSTLLKFSPHGEQYDPLSTDPAFWLTSRVVVHINNLDGSPINYAALSPQQIDDLHNRIYQLLRFDVLPAHVDIRGFGTDAEVGLSHGGAVPHSPSTEGIGIGETFSVDSFAAAESGAATVVAVGVVS